MCKITGPINSTKEHNILHKLGDVCVSIQQKISYLFVKEDVPTKTELSKEHICHWAYSTMVQILDNLKTSDIKDHFLNVENPFPDPKTGLATLIPKESKDASVMLQVLLWSCISKTCNESIVKSLKGIDANNTIPQKPTPPSEKCLMNWLQGMTCSIKGGLYYKSAHDVITQSLYIEKYITRTAELFSIIGKNGIPLKSITQEPSHKSIMKNILSKANLNNNKDNYIELNMPAVATFTYIDYLETRGVSCDILSFMMNFQEVKSLVHTSVARNSLSTLYNLKFKQDDSIGLQNKVRVPNREPICLLSILNDLVSIKIQGELTGEKILQVGKDKLDQIFGETSVLAGTGTPNVKIFTVMSLCLTSLIIQSRKDCTRHKSLHNFFADALTGCTKPTDEATGQQLIIHATQKLSRTMLSDDEFVQSYLDTYATKRTREEEDTLWKRYFVDYIKLSKLKNLLPPLEESPETHEDTTVKWLQSTGSGQCDKGVDKKYTNLRFIVLTLCVKYITPKEDEPLKPIKEMSEVQQFITRLLNDALHKAYYTKGEDGDRKTSNLVFFGGVMNHLSNTLLRHDRFLLDFMEWWTHLGGMFPEDKELWDKINIYNNEVVEHDQRNIMVDSDGGPKANKENVVQSNKRKHHGAKEDSKLQKKMAKDISVVSPKKRKDHYNKIFDRKNSTTNSSKTSKSTTRGNHKVTNPKPQTTPNKGTPTPPNKGTTNRTSPRRQRSKGPV